MYPAMTTDLSINLPQQLVSPGFIRTLAATSIVIMRRRVQERGRNLQDQQMAPYAQMTRQQRRQRGRQTAYRDLTDTGRMMGGIHVASVTRVGASGYQATVGFSTAYARQTGATHQERDPWFGLSRDDRRTLTAFMQQQLPIELRKQMEKRSQ